MQTVDQSNFHTKLLNLLLEENCFLQLSQIPMKYQMRYGGERLSPQRDPYHPSEWAKKYPNIFYLQTITRSDVFIFYCWEPISEAIKDTLRTELGKITVQDGLPRIALNSFTRSLETRLRINLQGCQLEPFLAEFPFVQIEQTQHGTLLSLKVS